MDPGSADGPAGAQTIRQVPLFSLLSDDELAWLWSCSRRLLVGPGDQVIEEGAPGDALFIVLSGEFEVVKNDAGRDIVLATRGPAQVIGEMSILDQAPRSASVRAATSGELLIIEAATFHTLIEKRPASAALLLKTVAERLRSTEALLVQSDKLAALGTLAAGLAHELNNPSAAIQRSGSLLRDAFSSWRERTAGVAALPLAPVERDVVAELERNPSRPGAPGPGDIALQTQESRLTDWLEPRAIPRPWETAPVLAASGWTVESLSALAEQLPETALAPVVLWLEADLAVRQLLDEIQMSARAISRIVEAVKSYAYLDKAPVQDVDIRQSLEDTLVILAHKLKPGIEIVRDLEPGLPSVEAYAGELNQVWTNIIDNAIQAMDGNGRLELAVRRLGDEVEVRIADSGPGIPPELTSRVFEPFFTTKPQGVGTGLGLHISHNIIVGRHHGRIVVTSRPGHTEFRVVLPLRQAPV